jgi:choline dehydrogenase
MKATGVEALIDGVQMQITARKEVIICAGAHNSPKILLLSGVGNATELAEVGIPALVDLPGVGHHMMDHINPGSLIFYGPSRTDYDGNLVGAYGRTGVVPHEATPDVEFGYIMGPAAEKQEHWPYVPSIHMFYCLMLNVDASGHVKLLSKDPLADPLIESGYFKNNVDQKRVVQVFRKLFAWADKMNKVLPLTQSSAGPYPLRISPASSDADIINEVRNTADTHWHVSGTCKMGNDADNLAVVDGQFRVRGVKQLRVVDASAMPVVPNGHPMATIMMMAERAVEWIVADNSE